MLAGTGGCDLNIILWSQSLSMTLVPPCASPFPSAFALCCSEGRYPSFPIFFQSHSKESETSQTKRYILTLRARTVVGKPAITPVTLLERTDTVLGTWKGKKKHPGDRDRDSKHSGRSTPGSVCLPPARL